MKRNFLKSKLHKVTITESNIDYEGSCMIDISLLNAAGILPYEKIDIYDITNGARLTTYAIPGRPDSGEICVNGAACHQVNIDDKVIICTYCELMENEIENHKPNVIHVNDKNEIIEKKASSLKVAK